MTLTASLTPQLLNALLRALWAGHPSQRARVLKALGRLDEATLSAEPVTGTFRRLLGGESDALTRGVGELISQKRLSVYAEDLIPLLKRGRERREWAAAWLRRLPLGRSARGALLSVASERDASLDARRAALQALSPPRTPRAKTAANDLDPDERARLLPVLAIEELHPELLRVWGEVDEAFVEAAIEANGAWGEELYRERVGTGGIWGRLFPARPSSLGVWPQEGDRQYPFLLGIARLAVAAKARRWLAALHEYLHAPGFGPLLARVYGEEVIREVAAPILGQQSNFWGDERTRVTVEVLGRLGERRATIKLRPLLPPPYAAPGALGASVIVALARLGDAEALEPHLKAVLARLEHHLRGGKGVPASLGEPAHPDAVAPGLEAARELEDARFAFPAFGLLAHQTPLASAGPGLPKLLARLQEAGVLGKEELALVSRLRVTLVPTDPKAEPSDFARAVALETIRLAKLSELVPALAEFARLPLLGSSAASLRDAAARALAELARPDDVEALKEVLFGAPLGDAAALKLWRALVELRTADEGVEAAERLLQEGRGGRRTQEAVLRWLGGELPPGRFLRLCLSLVRSPHGAVRTRALREAVARGLFAELGHLDDELERSAAPAARAPEQDLILDLLETACEAFAAMGHDADARRQVRVFLDALLPLGGAGPLDGDEVAVLRRRLRTRSAWVEVPTFHAMHRELGEVSALAAAAHEAGGDPAPDLGLLQAVILRGLGTESFPHPITGKRQRYWGPLPRFEATWASPSPFVQVALFDVVSSPDYLLTDGLLVRLLESPRALVRAGALAKLSRQACLVRADAILACLADPDPRVRRAVVTLLRSHELARHAGALSALLQDPEEGTRLLATRTLAEWGDPSCLEALTAFLTSSDDGLRAEAVQTLRGFDPSLLSGILAKHVRIETPRAAAAALAALRPDRLPHDSALGDAVFRVAALGSGPLRARALRFLPALADPARLGEVVPLLRDPNPSVRRAARDVLRRRDGRRHAPAVAEAAVAVRDPTQRLEVLGLLADLGVPEAAAGLVPLLLDPVFEVRRATRRALQAGRAFSRAPQLAELLGTGIEDNTDPQVLSELVRFLDQEAPLSGDEAIEWFASALRCEEPRVWRAALQAAWRRETTPEARAQSIIVDRLEACLHATPSPGAGVLGLVLREIERREVGQRPQVRKAVERLAAAPLEQGRASALRRKSMALLAAWELPEAGAHATRLVEAALAAAKEQSAALEVEAKRLKKEKPWYRGRIGTKGQRRELGLARAEAVGGERIRLALAAREGGSAFSDRARKLPSLIAKSSVLNEAIAAEAAARWEAELSFDVVKATGGLLGPDPERPKWARAEVLAPPLRVLARLRDRVEPADWLARAERLPKAIQSELDPVTRFTALAHRPTLDLAPWRKALGGTPTAKPSAERTRLEAFLLSCMEHWRPELRELFGELVKTGLSWHYKVKKDRWGRREREGRVLANRYARAQLRMGISGAIPALVKLAGEDPLALLILAAHDDAESLRNLLEKAAGVSEIETRMQLCGLLAEIGDEAAVAVLKERVHDDAPRVRALVAKAAWQVRGSARGPLLDLLPALLGDKDARVRGAALTAVGRLGLQDRSGAVEAALIGDPKHFDEAAVAACGAAIALGLTGQVGALLGRVEAESGKPQPAVLAALEALAGPNDAPLIVARISVAEGNPTRVALGRLLEGIWERAGAPADAVGAALSLQLGGEPFRWPVVIRLLGEAGYEPSAAALPDLMTHPEEGVRAAAARAAASLGAGTTAIDEALRTRLADEKEASRVRGAALESLVRRATPRQAWQLLNESRVDVSLTRSVLKGLEIAGLPQGQDLRDLISESSWDPASWVLEILIEEVSPGLGAPGPDETPLSLAQRLGFGGSELGTRVRALTAPEAAASEAGRRWLAGELAVSGVSCRVARRRSAQGVDAARVLQLPGAEAERALGELVLLRVLSRRAEAVLPCLRQFEGEGHEDRLVDAIERLDRPLKHLQLFEELAKLNLDAAIRLFPGEVSGVPELTLRADLLSRAAGSGQLEAHRPALAELLLAPQASIRWKARAALESNRLDPGAPFPLSREDPS